MRPRGIGSLGGIDDKALTQPPIRMHNGLVAVERCANESGEVRNMGAESLFGHNGKRMVDDELIGFELGWFQHGGGPAEKIREEFGVGAVEFFTQLRSRLDEIPDNSMSPHVIEEMKAVCRKRLWLARAS